MGTASELEVLVEAGEPAEALAISYDTGIR
jgi:hypothetical protein